MDTLRKFMLNETRKITVRKGSNIKVVHCASPLLGNTINGNVTERGGRLRVLRTVGGKDGDLLPHDYRAPLG